MHPHAARFDPERMHTGGSQGEQQAQLTEIFYAGTGCHVDAYNLGEIVLGGHLGSLILGSLLLAPCCWAPSLLLTWLPVPLVHAGTYAIRALDILQWFTYTFNLRA